MEQYDVTNADLSEQDLAHVSGGGWGSFVSGIVKGAKGAGRAGRDGAAVYGATTVVGSFTNPGSSGGGDGTFHIVPPKIDKNGNPY
jgi:hypothetical protein